MARLRYICTFRTVKNTAGITKLERIMSRTQRKSHYTKQRAEQLIDRIRQEPPLELFRKMYAQRQATLQRLESHPKAFSIFLDLVCAGCNPSVILREVGIYSGLTEPGLEKEGKRLRAEVERITVQLPKDAFTLWKIESEYMFDAFDTRRFYDKWRQIFEINGNLTFLAKELREALPILKRHTHKKTVRSKRLVYLCYHVHVATGHTRYTDIARVIASMPRYTDSNIFKLADAIRNAVHRQEKQDPDYFVAAKKAVQRDFDSWHYFAG